MHQHIFTEDYIAQCAVSIPHALGMSSVEGAKANLRFRMCLHPSCRCNIDTIFRGLSPEIFKYQQKNPLFFPFSGASAR